MKAVKNIPVLLMMLLIAAVSYWSCTKPGNISLPATQPKLVLHGYTETGDTFKIALGRTFRSEGELIQPDGTFIKNGWAALFEGGILVDSLIYNDSELRYVARKTIAQAGKTYLVRAGAPGFTSIEANSYAPAPVLLNSLTRNRNVRKDEVGTFMDDLVIKFRDPAASSNFYLTSIHFQSGFSTCVYSYDPAVERYTPDVMAFQDAFCIPHDAIMYTDRTFNGELKEIAVSVYGPMLDSITDMNGNIIRSYLRRYSITEEYYRYFLVNTSSTALVEEGPSFTVPATAKGNVKNGYGLFTIFSAVTDTIR